MRKDSASRLIAAPPEQVFRAFTDPQLLLAWLPPEGMTARLERFDAVTGYRMVLTYDELPEGGGKATADADVAEVRRVELAPPHWIVEAVDFPSDDPAYGGTMTMTWSFEPRPGGTLVTIEATDVPPGISAEDHVAGLTSSLENLARLVDGGATASAP